MLTGGIPGGFPFLPPAAPGTQMLQNIIANYMQTSMQQAQHAQQAAAMAQQAAAIGAQKPPATAFLNNNNNNNGTKNKLAATLPMKIPQHTERISKIDQIMEQKQRMQALQAAAAAQNSSKGEWHCELFLINNKCKQFLYLLSIPRHWGFTIAS